MGLTWKEIDSDSPLGVANDHLNLPLAASTNGLSATSDGGSAAAFSISSAAIGTQVFRSATGKKPLAQRARRLQLTKTDASGTSLKVTVRLSGRRFGVAFQEDVVLNASGTETVFSQRMYDELAGNPVIVAIEGQAASDTLAIGWDAKWIGLRNPIRAFDNILMVDRAVAGTRDVTPKTQADITAAMVKVGDAGLDISTLYSTDMLATHTYDIEYYAAGDRAGRKIFSRQGLKFG